MRLQSYFNRRLIISILLLNIAFLGSAQFHDGSEVAFGKNRVQYQDFIWQYFPHHGAEVYYYQGGKELAERVVAEWDELAQAVQQKMDRNLTFPIQVLVFNKQEDFRQCNIGAGQSEDANIGGTVTLVGSKLFVYGRGEHEAMRVDIQRGLAELIFYQSLYGGEWQEALRNNTLISFPDWYTKGLFSYISQPWSAEVAMHIEDAAAASQIVAAERTSPDDAALVGHGVWKYIADVFGETVIANVLYMTRISRNMEDGFEYATGMDLRTLLAEASKYHMPRFDANDTRPELNSPKGMRKARRDGGDLPFRLRRGITYRSSFVHPDGNRCVVVTEERGQITLWLYDLTTRERKRLGRHGHKIDRIQDDSFPVLAWHPNGRTLTYTLEERGRNFLINVDLESAKAESKEVFRIDKILSMDYSPDGRTMIWSGMLNGQSDLHLYQVIGNNHLPLWSDPYDDLSPVYSTNGDLVWFTSNRPEDRIPLSHRPGQPFRPTHDVFALDFSSEIPTLKRWLNTPRIDEQIPQRYVDERMTYLSEHPDGSQERWVAWQDSAIAFIDTTIHYRTFIQTRLAESFDRYISSFQYLEERQALATSQRHAGHLYWTMRGQDEEKLTQADILVNELIQAEELNLDWDWEPRLGEVDFRNYQFGPLQKQSVDETNKASPVDPDITEDLALDDFKIPAARNYRLNYTMESVTSRLDNSFGSAFYQPYNGQISVQPGLGGLAKISMSDLFEDHRFTAGFRLAGSLNNSRFVLAYSNLKDRLDKTWILERQGLQQVLNSNKSFVETHVHLLRYRLQYPLDEVRSIRLNTLFRLDRNTPLGTDTYNLLQPITFTNQIGIECAYVFDNSRERTMNIREGTRYRVWAEYFIDPSKTESTFGTFGFDARHYTRLFHDVIFAVRAAGNWSIGSQRLLHMLGGVDNPLSMASNTGSPIDPDILYAYQTRITPLRGFNTNARNGAHMAVINSELRMPVWTTFTRHPVDSDLLRHLQIVGFADIGSAWNGAHPYAEGNSFNQITVIQNPITVTVDNNREPIIWGAGFGLRSRILGYWMRADWSWGVDDARWQNRLFTLSMNLDF